MNKHIFRNNIMRKYLDYSSRTHLNCIRFDGGAGSNHDDKVFELCKMFRKNNIDFICRPVIEIVFAEQPKITFKKQVIPDILAFTQPKPSVIEVIDSESRDHAENKSYPSEFRVIPIGVEESIDVLEGLI